MLSVSAVDPWHRAAAAVGTSRNRQLLPRYNSCDLQQVSELPLESTLLGREQNTAFSSGLAIPSFLVPPDSGKSFTVPVCAITSSDFCYEIRTEMNKPKFHRTMANLQV
jgi:hypothetical protein